MRATPPRRRGRPRPPALMAVPGGLPPARPWTGGRARPGVRCRREGSRRMPGVPDSWYNIRPDLGFELPEDLPSPLRASGGINVQVPPALVRQELSGRRFLPIPQEVVERYRQWRPTPLRRAHTFERTV